MKSVQITTESRTNTVYLAAPADKIAQARRFIEDMDRPRGKDDPGVKIEPPEIRVYTVQAGTADVIAQTLSAANPGLSIKAVPNSNSIVVLATPDEHDEIQQQIFGRKAATGGGTDTVLLPLQNADPKEAAALLAKFLPNGPLVDIQVGALLVKGTKSQIDEAKQLLSTTYGERFDDRGSATVPGGNSRTISLDNGSAQALADLLADRGARMGRNPIILNGVNRNAPPTGPNPPPRGIVPPTGSGTAPGVNPSRPVVRPMWAPTPLPN